MKKYDYQRPEAFVTKLESFSLLAASGEPIGGGDSGKGAEITADGYEEVDWSDGDGRQ